MPPYILSPIEQYKTKQGFQFNAPGVGFFRTDDLDNIFYNTGQGIKAFGTNPTQGNTPPPGLNVGSLPKFNSGFVTDFAKEKYNQGGLNVEPFNPATIGQPPQQPQEQQQQIQGNQAQGQVQGQQGVYQPSMALQFGSQGDEVKNLQNYLIKFGYGNIITAGATGYFGEQTKAALSAWQKANNITTDPNQLGFFGPKSMAFINQGGQQQGGQGGQGGQYPSTPQAPSLPITGSQSLYSNQSIVALEKKIDEQSMNLAAGISAGGSTQILSELFTKFGIGEEMSLVNEFNSQILKQQQRLRELPEDIKEGLEDVGVSASQLNRLIVQETQKPMEILRDLMEQRGAAQDRINQSMKFVSLFQDSVMQDRAAKLEGMKFELEHNEAMLKNLKQEQKDLLNLALDDKAEILKIADNAITKGANPDIVDRILNSSSQVEARRLLAESGFGVKPDTSPTVIGSSTSGYYQYDSTNNTWKKIIAGTGRGGSGSAEEAASNIVIPEYEDFWKEALQTPQGQELAIAFGGDNIGLAKELRKLYELATQEIEGAAVKTKFSQTELNKLKQAGLSNAPLQKKLDFLYKKEEEEILF